MCSAKPELTSELGRSRTRGCALTVHEYDVRFGRYIFRCILAAVSQDIPESPKRQMPTCTVQIGKPFGPRTHCLVTVTWSLDAVAVGVAVLIVAGCKLINEGLNNPIALYATLDEKTSIHKKKTRLTDASCLRWPLSTFSRSNAFGAAVAIIHWFVSEQNTTMQSLFSLGNRQVASLNADLARMQAPDGGGVGVQGVCSWFLVNVNMQMAKDVLLHRADYDDASGALEDNRRYQLDGKARVYRHEERKGADVRWFTCRVVGCADGWTVDG